MRCVASSWRTGHRSGNHRQFRAVRTVESSGLVRTGPCHFRQTRRAHQRLANSRGDPNQACNPNTCEKKHQPTNQTQPTDRWWGRDGAIRTAERPYTRTCFARCSRASTRNTYAMEGIGTGEDGSEFSITICPSRAQIFIGIDSPPDGYMASAVCALPQNPP